MGHFGECDIRKTLPVLFVVAIIAFLFYTYMAFRVGAANAAEVYLFQTVAVLLVVCYLRCIFVHPGKVPEDPSWQIAPQDLREASVTATDILLKEFKKTGDRRQCKWCHTYKPDRCHHCRVCRTCILKMDHHCPWIYNCVGFGNYKYFFLLLFYSAIACHMIFWSLLNPVMTALRPETPFERMFLMLFGECLAGLIGAVDSAFFCFHLYLTLKGMTTIEFCEKSMKRTSYNESIYDRGAFGNIQAVLGDNPLSWWLPFFPPSGEGLVFVDEATRLAADVEAGGASRCREARGGSVEPKRRAARASGGTGSAPGSPTQSEDDSASDLHSASFTGTARCAPHFRKAPTSGGAACTGPSAFSAGST